jgi:hypothetical protein
MGVCGNMNFFERDRKKGRGKVYAYVRIGNTERGGKGRRCVW